MAELIKAPDGRILFTEEMKREYTILVPQMIPIHFALMEATFRRHGYRVELLQTNHPGIVSEGLTDVHNDTCYPALLIIGQLLDALKSGKYDVQKTALLVTQSGGGCRASNYIHLLRKALARNGLEHVPVISLNVSGMEKNPGFKLTVKLFYELLMSIFCGDLLMDVSNQIRPYEDNAGATDALLHQWITELSRHTPGILGFIPRVREICRTFAEIKIHPREKIKVAVVGEIYMKYAPLGNNNLEDFLRGEDVEVVVPGLMGFIQFMTDHYVCEGLAFGIKKKKAFLSKMALEFFCMIEKTMIQTMRDFPCFRPPVDFKTKKSLIHGYVSELNKMGEGWLLTAEMLELVHSGIPNIVCTQPFGCLPNHIVGKGMIRAIRQRHPEANIVAIDYDPGATRINQENRIKLMLANARGLNNAEHWPIRLPNAANERQATLQQDERFAVATSATGTHSAQQDH